MAIRDDPVEDVDADAAFSFLGDVQARLASDPPAQGEFMGLLLRFSRQEITDVRAVVARAAALLNGHPDLLARFHRFLGPSLALRLQDLKIQ